MKLKPKRTAPTPKKLVKKNFIGRKSIDLLPLATKDKTTSFIPFIILFHAYLIKHSTKRKYF